MTGSIAIAGAMAVVEPLVNAVALHAFDGWWARTAKARRGTPVAVPA